MKLSDQVISLEQAKRLKALGVINDNALFSWVVFCPDPLGEHYSYEIVYREEESQPAKYGEYLGPAFTVAEMGAILKGESPYWIAIWDEWGYKKNGQGVGYGNQATAYADKLIHLLENNLVSASEVNHRLSQ